MEDLFFTPIPVRNIFQTNAPVQPGDIYPACRHRVFFKGIRQFIHQSDGRFPACQDSRKLCDRPDNEIHQVHKHDHRSRRYPAPGQRQIAACQKHAQLRGYTRQCPDHPHHGPDTPSGKLFFFQGTVVFGKQLPNFLFCLKALYHWKSAKKVL